MAKLIYIDQKKVDAIKTDGTGKLYINSKAWNDSDNPYYNSLVFTKDGHLLTHGIDFSITPSSALIGGAQGSIPYQSVSDGIISTTFLAAPTGTIADATNGNYVLSFSSNAPVWKKIVNYKLSLNGTTNGDNNGTSLGSFYAPTDAGTSGQILQSSGGTPSWVSLITNLSASNLTNTGIPSALAVQTYVQNLTAGLTGAMHFKGVSTTNPTASGGPTVDGVSSFEAGDVVVYQNTSKEYVYDGTNWRELGDEGSYLLKSAKPISSTTLSIGTGTIGEGISVNLSSITVTNTKGNNNIVNGVTTDTYGRVTAVSYATAALTDTTHKFYIGATEAKANATSATANPYLTTKLTSAADNADGTNIAQFKGTDYLGVSAANGIITFTNNGIKTASASASVEATGTGHYKIGTITINGTTTTLYGHDVNTWREVKVYKIDSSIGTIDQLLSTSTGTDPLKFSNTFSVNSSDEIDLVWEEIDSSGNKTYHV